MEDLMYFEGDSMRKVDFLYKWSWHNCFFIWIKTKLISYRKSNKLPMTKDVHAKKKKIGTMKYSET